MTHVFKTFSGPRTVRRRADEALHPEREPLETLNSIRAIQGEFNFAGQYQQEPSPLGGLYGQTAWFKTYKGETNQKILRNLERRANRGLQSWVRRRAACESELNPRRQ
jgi:hypothetical protein